MTSSKLSSMTGFARSEGGAPGLSWAWEIKSVNGKGLDLRCRLPPGFEALEPQLRKATQAGLQRGSVQIALNLDRSAVESEVKVNQALLERFLAAAKALEAQGAAAPTADGLLGLRGVLEMTEPEESLDREARDALLLTSFQEALSALQVARKAEGAHLDTLLNERLEALGDLVAQAQACAETQPAALRARLERQVAELLEASPALPEERLAQEAALLATKADIREEIERLLAHIASAREMLRQGKGIGRKLDFLCQELNREANTLCSKAQDIRLTEIGLAMKSTVEQFREQVQNVE
ncbi:MAG: YicC/YloC family endoribonuclease [Kiloniellales bacterium]